MGLGQAKAFAAAKKLNALLVPGGDLVAKVAGGGKVVTDAIAVFRTDDVPDRGWSAVTAAGYEIVLKPVERRIGSDPLETSTGKDCANFIRTETESVRSRQVLRLVLGWVLGCAFEEGWIEQNRRFSPGNSAISTSASV